MPQINGERLLADLHHLRGFGAQGNGVIRPSLSAVDMASRRWLMGRLAEAGLEANIDGVGTVLGRSPKPGKALLIGSHTDTQPRGGWLDGAMGVIYGLEVARALSEAPETADLAVDVISFIDEEGTYLGMLGSRSYCGLLGEGEIEKGKSDKGKPLTEALAEAGLDGIAPLTLERERYHGYFEAHIEQGPYLEETDRQIGVVTGIVGIHGFIIRFEGQPNHAGTTPMPRRKDAGIALIDFGYKVNRAFKEVAGERTVWTMGNAIFDPGTQSIIPGYAELMLQFRDPDVAMLDALEARAADVAAAANAEGGVKVTMTPSRNRVAPVAMDADMQRHIAAAAEQHSPGRWMHMPSAAGHDAQVLALHMPSAMLFIPSIDGISHDLAEDSHEDDIVAGCQVMATATAAILSA